ncbi:hypothetical protein SDC9_211174 [bioreactor metagenome]|uniref:Uncharacterized protein n=1 Tax=bioreactor metagenome TaxID=1076179 RepID=A0A645JI94_9ZZZZ
MQDRGKLRRHHDIPADIGNVKTGNHNSLAAIGECSGQRRVTSGLIAHNAV